MNRAQREPRSPTLANGDTCFAAMVRHSERQRQSAETSKTSPVHAAIERDEDLLISNPELAWGATAVAAAMMGRSKDPAENNRRRRRVFAMYEAYRKACRDATERKRPLPANPGWIIMPGCNRIILCLRSYRAFIARQTGGRP